MYCGGKAGLAGLLDRLLSLGTERQTTTKVGQRRGGRILAPTMEFVG